MFLNICSYAESSLLCQRILAPVGPPPEVPGVPENHYRVHQRHGDGVHLLPLQQLEEVGTIPLVPELLMKKSPTYPALF
jgi:hypothetical protein